MTKEFLENKLAELETQKEQVFNNLNALVGAIQILEYLISEAVKAPEVEDNAESTRTEIESPSPKERAKRRKSE